MGGVPLDSQPATRRLGNNSVPLDFTAAVFGESLDLVKEGPLGAFC